LSHLFDVIIDLLGELYMALLFRRSPWAVLVFVGVVVGFGLWLWLG
jgi:hypothetical protein